MRTLYDSKELPGRRLQQRATITTSAYHSLGDVIVETQRKLIQELATTLVNEEKYVKLIPDNGQFVELYADVIILTSDEYLQLCKQKFKEGLEHATRYSPVEFMK